MAAIERAYQILYIGAAIYLAVTMFVCLVRAVIGPSLADRLVAVNIISCKVVILFAVVAVYLDALYLLDVCLTYALISFLAVVALSRVYLSSFGDGEYERLMNLSSAPKRPQEGPR